MTSPDLFHHDLKLCVQDLVPESAHCPLVLKIAVRDIHKPLPHPGGVRASGKFSHVDSAISSRAMSVPPRPEKFCYSHYRSEIFCGTLSESLNFHLGNNTSSAPEACYATALQEGIASAAAHASGHHYKTSHRRVLSPWCDDQCRNLAQISQLAVHDS